MSRLLAALVLLFCIASAGSAGAQPAAADDVVAARREVVAAILRTPQRDRETPLAAQHARELRALDFDALPVAADLLGNDRVSTEAARAMIAVDELRGLTFVLEATPRAALSTQLVGLSWYLDHERTLGQSADMAAHAAALRILDRIESTAIAQLAIVTIGLTGNEGDFPVLERLTTSRSVITQGLRSTSESVLARLGSGPHLEAILAEVATPLPANATYQQGMRVAESLRKAGLTGSPAMVPAICTHIADPTVTVVDISVNPANAAGTALSMIIEMSSLVRPREGATRSLEDWQVFCRTQPSAPAAR
jgi:hypothetical protein